MLKCGKIQNKMTNLRIKNVVIKKDAKGIIFILPQNFDGKTFRLFKLKYKKEIKNFRES